MGSPDRLEQDACLPCRTGLPRTALATDSEPPAHQVGRAARDPRAGDGHGPRSGEPGSAPRAGRRGPHCPAGRPRV